MESKALLEFRKRVSARRKLGIPFEFNDEQIKVVEDWFAKYYPCDPHGEMTTKEAIEHSLKKWEGLTEEGLGSHLTIEEGGVVVWFSREKFELGYVVLLSIDSSSCSLCRVFYSDDTEDDIAVRDRKRYYCKSCPLRKVISNPCDYTTASEIAGGTYGPYQHFMETKDPKPMLELLRRVKELYGKSIPELGGVKWINDEEVNPTFTFTYNTVED